METKATKKNSLLFLAGIIAAGAVHVVEKGTLTLLVKYGSESTGFTAAPYISTLGFCVNLSIFVFLLLCWIESLRMRLLPTRARTYLICTALLMIFYLALRSAKYRFADSNDYFVHVLWYLYYIPLIFIPALFLMTCIFMRNKGSARRFDERFVLIPAAALTAAVLTNDLHHFVFLFPWADEGLIFGSQGTYVRNAGYYVIVAFMAAAFILGIVLLTRINRSFHSIKKVIAPFLYILLMVVLLVMERAFGYYSLPRPYNPPEIVAFCMLGIFESCVRGRLIPRNENYAGFYRNMSLSSVITDRRFVPVYSTAAAVKASPDQLSASLESPVYTDRDTRLFGRRINAGYAFYTEDESELNRLNERLAEANELLASENELISAENEQKKKMARIESRNRIYTGVSGAMLRKRVLLAELLDECESGKRDIRAGLARACVIIAYIKRASDILLSGDEGEPIPADALSLACGESVRYLPYCGIKAIAAEFRGSGMSREHAFLLYTAFEELCEAVIGDATMLTVSLSDGVMRVTADCRKAPEIGVDGVAVRIEEAENVFYVTFRCGEEGNV